MDTIECAHVYIDVQFKDLDLTTQFPKCADIKNFDDGFRGHR